jgi:hypothetical protein
MSILGTLATVGWKLQSHMGREPSTYKNNTDKFKHPRVFRHIHDPSRHLEDGLEQRHTILVIE